MPKVNVNVFDSDEFYWNTKNNTNQSYALQIVHGFRIKNFVYLTDVSKKVSENGCSMQIGVLDSLRKEPHLSHLWLEESIDLLNELKQKQAPIPFWDFDNLCIMVYHLTWLYFIVIWWFKIII